MSYRSAPTAFTQYAQQQQAASGAAMVSPEELVQHHQEAMSFYGSQMQDMQRRIAELQASEAAAQEHAVSQEHEVAESAGFAALGRSVVSKLNEVAAFGENLQKSPNTITKTLRFTFAFNKRKADGSVKKSEPGPASFSAAQLERAFGVSMDKPVYVKDIVLTKTHSTAPYPLGFTLRGVKGKDTAAAAVFSNTGADVTAVVLPGTQSHEETVYDMGNVDADFLKFHGNATKVSEAGAFQTLKVRDPVTGAMETKMFLDPESRMGQLFSAYQHTFMPEGKELVPYSREIPMYRIDPELAKSVVEDYNKEIISKLPRTELADLQGALSRLDREDAAEETADKKRHFSDATDAPGLARGHVDSANSATHVVHVMARVSIIDPAFFSAGEQQ